MTSDQYRAARDARQQRAIRAGAADRAALAR